MDSFKASVVSSTIFAQRFNGAGGTLEVIPRFFKLAVVFDREWNGFVRFLRRT